MSIFAKLPANQFGAAQHVAPLVIASELHIAAVVLEQVVEIVGLHGHVVELQEAQALLHPLLEALCPEHIVHGEAGTDVPDEVDIVQVQQPVSIVHHLGLALTELNEPLHLLFEAGTVVVDGLLGHHAAHIGPARGVTDHGRAAANQGNGLIARHLQPLHKTQGHKMAYMERIRRGVETNVEGGLAVIHHFPNFFLVGHLSDQSTGYQFVKHFHFLPPR